MSVRARKACSIRGTGLCQYASMTCCPVLNLRTCAGSHISAQRPSRLDGKAPGDGENMRSVLEIQTSVPSCYNSVFSALLHGTYTLQLLPRMLMVRDTMCYLLNSSNIAGRSRSANKACGFSARLAASAIDNSAAAENKPSWLGLEGMEILLLWRVLTATSSCCAMGPWSGSASQGAKYEGLVLCLHSYLDSTMDEGTSSSLQVCLQSS